MSDDIVKDYGTDEFFRAAPSAYGVVSTAGTLTSGTANIASVVWDSSLSRYEIDFADFSYSTSFETAAVTPRGSTPRFATSSSVGGSLLVYVFDLSGNRVQGAFSFVVFENDSPATLLDSE